MKMRNITIMELLLDLQEIEIKLSVYIAHWKICVLTKIVDCENVNSIPFSIFSRNSVHQLFRWKVTGILSLLGELRFRNNKILLFQLRLRHQIV